MSVITKSDTQESFRGAGLVLSDAERVIIKLDIHLRTPTPSNINVASWLSNTLSNTLEFRSQSTLIWERIQRYINGSPTLMVEAVEKLAKGAEMMVHSLVLKSNQAKELQTAFWATSRQKSRERKCIQIEETITTWDGVRLTTLNKFTLCRDEKKAKKSAHADGHEPTQRRCRRHGEAAHHSCTCKRVEELLSD